MNEFFGLEEGLSSPEICIRDVSLNEFVQRVVDDFLEVHCVLLTAVHRELTNYKGADGQSNLNEDQRLPSPNKQTRQMHRSPKYRQLTKPFLMRACCETLPCWAARDVETEFTSVLLALFDEYWWFVSTKLARNQRQRKVLVWRSIIDTAWWCSNLTCVPNLIQNCFWKTVGPRILGMWTGCESVSHWSRVVFITMRIIQVYYPQRHIF